MTQSFQDKLDNSADLKYAMAAEPKASVVQVVVQVKTNDGLGWCRLTGVEGHVDDQDKMVREMERQKSGWMLLNYFPDAVFRVVAMPKPNKRIKVG